VPKIAVFDSGLGSLSIIAPIRKKTKSEIIYFADQASYPYGTKSVVELEKIIKSTISKLQEKFHPDVIIIGSNTPSLLLDITKNQNIIGIFPPLKEASNKTKTGTIAILATKSVVESNALEHYIKKNVPDKIKVIKLNASSLVDLVESGKFIFEKESSKKTIRRILEPVLKNADVVTLSSTHLPFLLPMLNEIFPSVTFLDPADMVADQVVSLLKGKKSKRRTLKIFASGDIKSFQKRLGKIGIKNKVVPL
jgi:glutamate racemase